MTPETKITRAIGKMLVDENISLYNFYEFIGDTDIPEAFKDYDSGSYCGSCGKESDSTYTNVSLSSDPHDYAKRTVSSCCEAYFVNIHGSRNE